MCFLLSLRVSEQVMSAEILGCCCIYHFVVHREYMEMIRDDEYLEITPKSLRLRKIILDEIERKRQSKREESVD